jgi:glycosyltransferase involved in cell wall biosynthesis
VELPPARVEKGQSMAPSKKVALLFHSLAIKGGAGNVTVWLADTLVRRGFEVTVFTASFDSTLWPEELLSSFSVRILPEFSPWLLARRSNLLKRRHYGKILAKELDGVDVIIPNNNPSIQWVHIAKKLNRNLGKVLWLCQEPTRHLFGSLTDRHFFNYKQYSNGSNHNEHIAQALRRHKDRIQRKARKLARSARWEREAASTASTIIANSQFSAENIKRVFSRDSVVIYPGILPTSIAQTSPNEKPEEEYICYVGRLSVMKNIDTLIEAFRIVCTNGVSKNLKLKIVGEGPWLEVLRQKALDSGLQDRVRFLGRLSDKELPEFFANALLTVYVPIDEPFGLVPFESLRQRTPVIVSNHGGPGELLTHRENAYVVNPFDPEQIADMITHCLDNADEGRRLAESGCALVESSLTLERFVDRLEKFF